VRQAQYWSKASGLRHERSREIDSNLHGSRNETGCHRGQWRADLAVRADRPAPAERVLRGDRASRSLPRRRSGSRPNMGAAGASSMRHCLRVAEVVPDEPIFSALRRELSRTHLKTLIYLDAPLKRDFHIALCRVERWRRDNSTRECSPCCLSAARCRASPTRSLEANSSHSQRPVLRLRSRAQGYHRTRRLECYPCQPLGYPYL
jgi:hypothetical protein